MKLRRPQCAGCIAGMNEMKVMNFGMKISTDETI
jgi:hypothetical protein